MLQKYFESYQVLRISDPSLDLVESGNFKILNTVVFFLDDQIARHSTVPKLMGHQQYIILCAFIPQDIKE